MFLGVLICGHGRLAFSIYRGVFWDGFLWRQIALPGIVIPGAKPIIRRGSIPGCVRDWGVLVCFPVHRHRFERLLYVVGHWNDSAAGFAFLPVFSRHGGHVFRYWV